MKSAAPPARTRELGSARRASSRSPHILVAGVGNVLRGDDGFGSAVVWAWDARGPVPGVRTVDVGIGGMGIVRELLEESFDALFVVDAVGRGGEPGSVYVLDVDVPGPERLDASERLALSAGAHQLVPTRVLVQARALDVLPPMVRIVGCEPGETEELAVSLSPPVAAAVPRALELLDRLRRTLMEEVSR